MAGPVFRSGRPLAGSAGRRRRPRRFRTRSLFGLLLGLLLLAGATVGAAALDPGGTVWRYQFFNDAFVGSDNQFTNGLAVQMFSPHAATLAATVGTPAFGKGLARLLLPHAEGLHYREGWSFGHSMQTPNRIIEQALQRDDVPFASTVGWGNSFTAIDNERFAGFELMVGWVGSATGGKQFQRAAHAVTGARDPKGWGNQLSNEPLVNLYYMRKRKLWQRPYMDVSVNGDAALGTYFTYGQAAVETRFGAVPAGFAMVPTPIGRGLNHDARLRQPGVRYRYASLVVRGTRFLHAAPRDGSVLRTHDAWTIENTITRRNRVRQAVIGVHEEGVDWGAHFHLWLSSDTVGGDTSLRARKRKKDFGVVTLERRL